MQFVSTAGVAAPTDLRTALFQGLAPDGGLYLPETLVPLSSTDIASLRGAPLQCISVAVGRHLLSGELDESALEGLLADALDFPIPVVALEEGVYILELFHGPTAAFKDIAARIMARLMSALRAEDSRALTVLTATSGDTGGAVAQAFLGLPGIQVVVLYPHGRISPLQERQFTTLGGNVRAFTVLGTFDDCQRLAKGALADAALQESLQLTSANSINIGRLLPQVLYYAHGWGQLPAGHGGTVFSVPSGNFGNLTAGLMAKRLGIPIERFVAATNANDVVPEYLRTGRLRARSATSTISSAMDVGDPSNVARILKLYDYRLDGLRRDIAGRSFTDDDTRNCIREVYERCGYVLDPHSAVGYLGLQQERAERAGTTGVCLATAHPAKFRETVEPIIGRSLLLPKHLDDCLRRDPVSVMIEPRLSALRKALLEEGHA